ncbi:hypothetical protein EVAR_93592_1 [Eumeta japonica]|uniref:Uncharacterized protein n=1 Tax=Eumeta variegata TaxID=151549 RepID=A0A4C1TQI6_EUMVA|nr:hypothetical protein EVAR_93592_1 [Eumeta japonica]
MYKSYQKPSSSTNILNLLYLSSDTQRRFAVPKQNATWPLPAFHRQICCIVTEVKRATLGCYSFTPESHWEIMDARKLWVKYEGYRPLSFLNEARTLSGPPTAIVTDARSTIPRRIHQCKPKNSMIDSPVASIEPGTYRSVAAVRDY